MVFLLLTVLFGTSHAANVNLPVQRYVLAEDAATFQTELDNGWVNETISSFRYSVRPLPFHHFPPSPPPFIFCTVLTLFVACYLNNKPVCCFALLQRGNHGVGNGGRLERHC